MILRRMWLCSARRTEHEADATLLLDTFAVIHFFVTLIGATLGVLLRILTTPKAFTSIYLLAASLSRSASCQTSFGLYEKTVFLALRRRP